MTKSHIRRDDSSVTELDWDVSLPLSNVMTFSPRSSTYRTRLVAVQLRLLLITALHRPLSTTVEAVLECLTLVICSYWIDRRFYMASTRSAIPCRIISGIIRFEKVISHLLTTASKAFRKRVFYLFGITIWFYWSDMEELVKHSGKHVYFRESLLLIHRSADA